MKKENEMKPQGKMDVGEANPARRPGAKKKWQKPVLEDVSGKVMAQPYIRFT